MTKKSIIPSSKLKGMSVRVIEKLLREHGKVIIIWGHTGLGLFKIVPLDDDDKRELASPQD